MIIALVLAIAISAFAMPAFAVAPKRFGCTTTASTRSWAYVFNDKNKKSMLKRGNNWDNPARVAIDAMWRYNGDTKISAPNGTTYGGWIYLYDAVHQDLSGNMNDISGTTNRVFNNKKPTVIRYLKGGGAPNSEMLMRVKASSSCQASWGSIYFDGRWSPDY